MPCALVAPNSPIFSPSKIPSIFCRSSSSSPRLLHAPTTPSSRTCNNPLSSPKDFPARFQSQRHLISNYTKDPSGLGSAPGLALKRKRPMRIDIPVAPVSFAVDSSKSEERVEAVEVDEDGYSVYCKRGKRGLMEDRYSAVVDLHGDSTQAFFGVFDGHGGSKAAEFAAKNLDKNIVDRLAGGGEENVMEAVKDGYLATDVEFLKEDVSGGACCVTALVHKGNLVVSNAGDCRAVMS